MNKKYRERLYLFLTILVVVYLYLLIFGKNIETNITFPGVGIDSIYSKWPDLDYEEINIKDDDGENINGIFLKGESDFYVYYFHGNGLPLSYFLYEIKYINSLGYNVLAYDYPGYGDSEGTPYEENINKFSNTFYEYVNTEKNIDANKLILWGGSVGTAVATDFAKDNNFYKMVLISPFYSRYDMAEGMMGFTLQKYVFLKNSFTTGEYLKNIDKPLLVIHGTADELVPFVQGKRVFDSSISNDKKFIGIPDFGHNGIIYKYGEELRQDVIDFLQN